MATTRTGLHVASTAIFLLVFVVDPAGCGPATDDFSFGETEMVASIQGTWRIDVAATDGGGPSSLTIEMRQAEGTGTAVDAPPVRHRPWLRSGGVRRAYACGSRTFVKSAGACTDSSSISVRATVRTGNDLLPTDTIFTGDYVVQGTKFGMGELRLSSHPVLSIFAVIEPTGNVPRTDVTVGENPGVRTSATMTRVAP